MDTSFWPNALAKGSGGISEQCFLRVLRGALHGRKHAIKALEQLEATKAICCSCRTRHCKHVHPTEVTPLDYNALDASVTQLWHSGMSKTHDIDGDDAAGKAVP